MSEIAEYASFHGPIPMRATWRARKPGATMATECEAKNRTSPAIRTLIDELAEVARNPVF